MPCHGAQPGGRAQTTGRQAVWIKQHALSLALPDTPGLAFVPLLTPHHAPRIATVQSTEDMVGYAEYG